MFAAIHLATIVASIASASADFTTWGDLPTVALDCSGECMPFNGAVTNGELRPCCEDSDVLVIKDGFQFAQCRRRDGESSETWASGNVVICNGKGGGFDGEEAVVENGDNATESVDGESGDGDAVPDSSSGEGFCEASGLPSCARTTKCCASSRMPLTNCCEAGSKCIAKNKFYAACLPPFREERALNDAEWLAVELKCGEDVEALPDISR